MIISKYKYIYSKYLHTTHPTIHMHPSRPAPLQFRIQSSSFIFGFRIFYSNGRTF